MNRLRLSNSGCGLFTAVVMLLGGCTASSPDHSIDRRSGADATTGGAASVASTGGLGSATGSQPSAAECQNGSGVSPGTSPLRRLTHYEYDNTVEELLGTTSKPARAFPLEERAFGFENNASARSVSPILAEQYEGAASRLSSSLDTSALLSCDPATVGEDACGAQFIDDFGLKSYRRPLTPVEQSQMLVFFAKAKTENGFANAIQMVVSAFLQTPQFLYRMETSESVGAKVAGALGVREVGPYERATRLSYLLTQSMPDKDLLGAASRGELGTKEEVAAQARRLLNTPKARSTVVSFHSQWLDFGSMAQLVKDATLYPKFSTEVASLMRQEADAFVEHTVFDGAGDWGALLQSTQSYMNDPLAAFYGAPLPGSATAFAPVALPASERSGLLTLAGLLAGHSNPTQGSPVARGFFVRDSLLCQTPPPPPPGVNIVAPAFDPTLSTRERFAAHSENPSCKVCHELMDPIGFGFEHYDAVGMWRLEESGARVDASGRLINTDVDGAFNGAIELGQKLAVSKVVSDCVTTRWFHFAHGRLESADDACTLNQLKSAFSASKGNIKDLLVALTQTDAFLYRNAP